MLLLFIVYVCIQHGHHFGGDSSRPQCAAQNHSHLCLLLRDDSKLQLLYPLNIFFTSFSMPPSPSLSLPHQAFIHPSLARFFWSVDPNGPSGWSWSPYAYCNGTFTSTITHEFRARDPNLPPFVFIDFAGSGIVHLCGKPQMERGQRRPEPMLGTCLSLTLHGVTCLHDMIIML